jgi:hypothetical protein
VAGRKAWKMKMKAIALVPAVPAAAVLLLALAPHGE